MSYCKNCGHDIGDANFCPSCGKAAIEIPQPQTTSNVFSNYYPELSEYLSLSTKLYVFGILSLIFCMSIGLIFEIICIVVSAKIKKMFEHGDKLTNPIEIAMYNKAKSRHKTGAILFCIAFLITSILLFILFMSIQTI